MSIQAWLRIMAEAHPANRANYLEAAEAIDTLRATLRQADREIERLQKRAAKEVEEFNAGYDHGANGGSIDDEPVDRITEDQWTTGFKAGCYERLQAIVDRLRAVACEAYDDIGYWIQLAIKQRNEMPHNAPNCPTGNGLNQSDRVRKRIGEALREAAEKARTP